MFFDGSPSTSSRSASLPTVIDPVRLSTWTLRAAAMVAVASASAGRHAALDVKLELADQLQPGAVGPGDDRHAGFAQHVDIFEHVMEARRGVGRASSLPGKWQRPGLEAALGGRRQRARIGA